MLVERLKQACDEIDWEFNYGRDHWQNLQDLPDDGDQPFEDRIKYLMLLWKDRDFLINDFGVVEGYIFDGELILSVRSRLSDPSSEYKYETHIKNLELEVEKLFEDVTVCEEWTIKRWKESEVQNVYDTNMDGLKVRFQFEYKLG